MESGLLVAALSACHRLWYLHLCADVGIVITAYSDDASGVEIEQACERPPKRNLRGPKPPKQAG
jgi:organic hydroperoxide reductase OsmC/OhrA